jgi:hypothetical protein
MPPTNNLGAQTAESFLLDIKRSHAVTCFELDNAWMHADHDNDISYFARRQPQAISNYPWPMHIRAAQTALNKWYQHEKLAA